MSQPSIGQSMFAVRPCGRQPPSLSVRVERLGVVGTHGDPGALPDRVGRHHAFVVHGQLGLGVAARIAVRELVEAGIGLGSLDDRELREPDPRRLDGMRPVSYTHLTLPTIYSV